MPRAERRIEIHRDTYLEQQQTEKNETEVRDVDTNHESVRMLSRAAFGGVIRALRSEINNTYAIPTEYIYSLQLSSPH